MTYSPKEGDKWHPFYDNPEDTIIICSSDGWLFRASEHRLSQSSSFFRHLLSLGQVGATDEAVAVTLEASKTTVETLLDMIHFPPQYTAKIASIAEWHDLWNLAQFFDCEDILTRLADLLDIPSMSVDEYWSYLSTFSKTNDLYGGKRMLRELRSRHLCHLLFPARMQELDPVWAIEIEKRVALPVSYRPYVPNEGFAMYTSEPYWVEGFDPYGDLRKTQEKTSTESTSSLGVRASEKGLKERDGQ